MKRFFHVVLAIFVGILVLATAGSLFSGCASGTTTAEPPMTESARADLPDKPEAYSLDIAPPPSPVVPPDLPEPSVDLKTLLRETITYDMGPGERQEDAYGYISLTYRTAEEVIRDKAVELDIEPGDASGMQRLLKMVPAGGLITIDINRKDLLHANTKWYSYALQFANDKTISRKKGQESIPFVKGRENLWWNTDEMPVPRPLEGSLTLCVEDAKNGKTYCFTITRNVTYEALDY